MFIRRLTNVSRAIKSTSITHQRKSSSKIASANVVHDVGPRPFRCNEPFFRHCQVVRMGYNIMLGARWEAHSSLDRLCQKNLPIFFYLFSAGHFANIGSIIVVCVCFIGRDIIFWISSVRGLWVYVMFLLPNGLYRKSFLTGIKIDKYSFLLQRRKEKRKNFLQSSLRVISF